MKRVIGSDEILSRSESEVGAALVKKKSPPQKAGSRESLE
jgi:hypothetical protein